MGTAEQLVERARYNRARNDALERAAQRLERMLCGREPVSGETLAIHCAIATCASLVRSEKT
jgi:hypothetical protein